MAKLTEKITLGIDVAKHQLVVCNWMNNQIIEIDNDPKVIKTWLRSFSAPLRIAIEPTSTYHMAVVDAALALDHQVYLINPRQLHHYRDAINIRNKTDPQDAWLLARYLVHEQAALKPYQPQCRQAQQLWALLKRRASVIKARQQLQQSMAGVQLSTRALLTQFRQLLRRIDQRIEQLIQILGWQCHYLHCCSIPGIGPLNAAALVTVYHRGTFASSDAFVAFLGLDVRMRESGQYRGQRKLTKQGDSELRRLLYCAAQAARCHPRFAE